MLIPNTKQLNTLINAVNAYNEVRDAMEQSGQYDVVPNRTSVERELDTYISDKRSFNDRVKQLKRITNKDAAKPVVRYGIVVPKYFRDEVKNAVRQSDTRRAATRLELFPNWGEMTSVEKAEALSNKNLEPLFEEDYYSAEMFDYLMEDIFPNMDKKSQGYINVWLDNGGDEYTASHILEMANENPEGFRRLMESPDIEKDIEYIYPTEGDFTGNVSGYKYKRGSAYKDDYTLRMNKASAYWEDQYEDFLNHRGYFHD